jgi:hypothetical protein
VVLFIDELDRCRPSYAVEVIEQVKQLFTVSGIVFVLSIDRVQLCHAIRGVYGNDNINSDEYLRRFIDIEYSLPEPNAMQFCNYLYEYFQFDDFFNTESRMKHYELRNDGEAFIEFSKLIFRFGKYPLRVQEKIFAHARLALCSFNKEQYVLPYLFVFLIYLRTLHKDIYNGIKNHTFTRQVLVSMVEDLINLSLTEIETRIFVFAEALLLITYESADSNHQKTLLIDINNETKEYQLTFNSKLDNKLFVEAIESVKNNRFYVMDLSINHLIDRIELFIPIFN